MDGNSTRSGAWLPLVDARPEHPSAARHLAALSDLLTRVAPEALDRVVDVLLDAQAYGRRVYVIGNGGSSATASHLACDLAKTSRVPGHGPLRAFSLTDNTPMLTAWANDTSYEECFAQQIDALVEPGDVVVAISASGNSPNIVAGIEAAAARGARTIGLLGFDGGAARDLVETVLHVPCHDYGLVEDVHVAIGHSITVAIRDALASRDREPACIQSSSEQG